MSLKNIDDDKKLVKEDEPIIGDDPNSSNDSSNKDINKNLGKFNKKDVSPQEVKINPLHKVNIDQQKINFAKFETKKTNLLTKHKFFENFGVILNKKKWCITIILIEFFLMSLFIGVASFLIKNIKKDSKIVKIKNKWNDFEISTRLIPIKKEEIKYKRGRAKGQMQIIQKI